MIFHHYHTCEYSAVFFNVVFSKFRTVEQRRNAKACSGTSSCISIGWGLARAASRRMLGLLVGSKLNTSAVCPSGHGG